MTNAERGTLVGTVTLIAIAITGLIILFDATAHGAEPTTAIAIGLLDPPMAVDVPDDFERVILAPLFERGYRIAQAAYASSHNVVVAPIPVALRHYPGAVGLFDRSARVSAQWLKRATLPTIQQWRDVADRAMRPAELRKLLRESPWLYHQYPSMDPTDAINCAHRLGLDVRVFRAILSRGWYYRAARAPLRRPKRD